MTEREKEREKLIEFIRTSRRMYMEDDDYDYEDEYIADRLLAYGFIGTHCVADEKTEGIIIPNYEGECRRLQKENAEYREENYILRETLIGMCKKFCFDEKGVGIE